MNRKKSFVLTKNDREAARLFTELGMSKNLAKTLMYLSHVDECYSADIEQGANLRQPEVSLVMQELRRRKWAGLIKFPSVGNYAPVGIRTRV